MSTTEQQNTATDGPPAVQAIARITEAWANNDASAFASVFTEDATMILPGVYVKGREAIAEFMSKGYAGPYRGTRVTGTPVDVRVIGDDLTIVVTEGGVLMPGETEPDVSRRIKATWVVVRRGKSDWQLAAYHNAPAEQSA
ncbi:conserved hypothetical protein [Actinopolyspora lacussalsi subsp. righensis]|uniref:DUF4440 domain-containing protein n=1 Tax=Actinopolyspora righensis TaxID=995060 RepID=A0A1I6XCV9_9ACTN|nr:SgcJ/EcaC family oxidoreductase [Actinopolyspora righensis]SFT36098.1 conserved hypothetical protein [Actinopolyspora righensis]